VVGNPADPEACRNLGTVLAPGPVDETRAVLGDADLVRSCAGSTRCRLAMVGRGRPAAEANGADYGVLACAAYVAVRLTPDIVLLQSTSRELYTRTVSTEEGFLLRRGDLWGRVEAGDVNLIRGNAGPPWPWVGGALAGALLVALSWARRRTALRSLRSLEGAREGVLGDDGAIVFADGASLLLASEVSLPPGPVVVLAPRPRCDAYRDAPTLAARDVLAGTLADRLDEDRDSVLRHEAWALAIACVAGAPLAGAAFAGLVF
jgi:hypothetical protein